MSCGWNRYRSSLQALGLFFVLSIFFTRKAFYPKVFKVSLHKMNPS